MGEGVLPPGQTPGQAVVSGEPKVSPPRNVTIDTQYVEPPRTPDTLLSPPAPAWQPPIMVAEPPPTSGGTIGTIIITVPGGYDWRAYAGQQFLHKVSAEQLEAIYETQCALLGEPARRRTSTPASCSSSSNGWR